MNRVRIKSFIRFFNMVEVTLAIAVVGIGVAGIMSLFPVAVSSTRDSIADNYSADIADQIIAYVSALAAQDKWDAGATSTTSTFKATIPDAEPSNPASGADGSLLLGNIYEGSSANDGVYKVVMKSNSGAITDFSAYVKVWREKLPPVYVAGMITTANWDSSFTYGAGIHIEISYPAEAPYDQRKKINFYFEVFNPKPNE